MADKFLRNIVEDVYESEGNTVKKGDIENVLRKALDVMGDYLANGDKLYLIGFMNFEPKDYRAKNSSHPQTHEPMVIPAYRGVLSKPSDPLKKKLTEGYARDHGV